MYLNTTGELKNATIETLPVAVARQVVAQEREEMKRLHAEDLAAIGKELEELAAVMRDARRQRDSAAFQTSILSRLERVRTQVDVGEGRVKVTAREREGCTRA